MDVILSIKQQGATVFWQGAENQASANTDVLAAWAPEAQPPVPDAKPAEMRRILIVDDDESVRETLAELLEIAGFCSLQAADAAEALGILRHPPAVDVLVTDLTMPGDDGITLIRRARELQGSLPAILLTGYAEQVTSVSTIAGGNFHVLRKPVESDRLIEQLELLIAQHPPA